MSITWDLTSFDTIGLGEAATHHLFSGFSSGVSGAALAFEGVNGQTIQTYRRTDSSAAHRISFNKGFQPSTDTFWRSSGMRLHTNGVIDGDNPLIKFIYRDSGGTWRYGTRSILVGNTTAWRSCYIEFTYNPISKLNTVYIDGVSQLKLSADLSCSVYIGNTLYNGVTGSTGGLTNGANNATGTYAIKNTTQKIGVSDAYNASAPAGSRSQVIMLGSVRVRQKRMRLVSHDPSWTNDTDIDTRLDKTRPASNTAQPNPTPVTVRVGGGSGVFMPDLTDSNDQIIAGNFVMGHARQTGQSGKLQMDFTNRPDAEDTTITGNVSDTVTVAMRDRVFGVNGTPISKTQVENTRVILTPIPV